MDLFGSITGSKKRREKVTEECEKQLSLLNEISSEVYYVTHSMSGIQHTSVPLLIGFRRTSYDRYEPLLASNPSEKILNDLHIELVTIRERMEKELEGLLDYSARLAEEGRFDDADKFTRHIQKAYALLGRTDKVNDIGENNLPYIYQLRKRAEPTDMSRDTIERVSGTPEKRPSDSHATRQSISKPISEDHETAGFFSKFDKFSRNPALAAKSNVLWAGSGTPEARRNWLKRPWENARSSNYNNPEGESSTAVDPVQRLWDEHLWKEEVSEEALLEFKKELLKTLEKIGSVITKIRNEAKREELAKGFNIIVNKVERIF